MDLVQYGAATVLAITLFTLVDKILVPVFRTKFGGSSTDERGASSEWKLQEYVNAEQGERLNRHDKELSEIRGVISEISRNLDVSQAILERIEESIKN